MANKNFRTKNMKFNTGKSNSGIKKRLGVVGPKVGVVDARQRIIQKKRKNVTDARDILAKMAKTQDARNKINKLREYRNGDSVINSNIRSIGAHILRKTDRNGKISLVTNKSKQQPASTMNLTIQQQLGLIPPIHPKKTVTKTALSVSTKSSVRNFTPPVIRKTILNDLGYSPPRIQHSSYGYEQPDVYRWFRPDLQPPPPVMPALETRRPLSRSIVNNGPSDWRSYRTTQNRSLHAPSSYIDLDAVEDEEMPLVPAINRGISIHARLDTNPSQSQSHGILSQTKTKVVVPAGHRIVVSNLQSTVTQDDIRELFEDIGQLLVARLVRPGTAEVIYKNLKDAQKAVDTYHNRQLDGQPMKCLLVNKRPLNNPTAPALVSTKNSESILTRKSSSSNSNKLVPDLDTIHKVLFQRN